MVCIKCGKTCSDELVFCPFCGTKLEKPPEEENKNEEVRTELKQPAASTQHGKTPRLFLTAALIVLSFLVGFLVGKKSSHPNAAKSSNNLANDARSANADADAQGGQSIRVEKILRDNGGSFRRTIEYDPSEEGAFIVTDYSMEGEKIRSSVEKKYEWPNGYDIPYVLTEAEYEKWKEKSRKVLGTKHDFEVRQAVNTFYPMVKKNLENSWQYDQYRINYPALADGSIYIIKETESDSIKKKIEEGLHELGYTHDDFLRDKERYENNPPIDIKRLADDESQIVYP